MSGLPGKYRTVKLKVPVAKFEVRGFFNRVSRKMVFL